MTKRIPLALALAIAAWTADTRTTHDDPISGENSSIRLRFDSKTTLDPYTHQGATVLRSLQDIIQHTHDLHTVLLFDSGRPNSTPPTVVPIAPAAGVEPEIHIFFSGSENNGPYVDIPALSGDRGHIVITRTIDQQAGLNIGGHKGALRNILKCGRGQACPCLVNTESKLRGERKENDQTKEARSSKEQLSAKIVEAVNSPGCGSSATRRILADHLRDAFTVWRTRIEEPLQYAFEPATSDGDWKTKLGQQPKRDSNNKLTGDQLLLNVVSRRANPPALRMRRIDVRVGTDVTKLEFDPNATARFQICNSEEVAASRALNPRLIPCALPPRSTRPPGGGGAAY